MGMQEPESGVQRPVASVRGPKNELLLGRITGSVSGMLWNRATGSMHGNFINL